MLGREEGGVNFKCHHSGKEKSLKIDHLINRQPLRWVLLIFILYIDAISVIPIIFNAAMLGNGYFNFNLK